MITDFLDTNTGNASQRLMVEEKSRYALSLSATRVPAIDGLRGIAILFVMLYHFHFVFRGDSGPGYWVFRSLNFGWSGVDLFFVISGFLISGILLDAKGTVRFIRHFYTRRVLRLAPLYYAYVGVVFLLIYPLSSRSVSFLHDGLWYLAYLNNWKPNHGIGDTYLSHLWSLAVEEQFYFIWPLLIALIPKRVFPFACASAIVIAPCVRMALLAHGANEEIPYRLTIARMDGLAWGGLTAWLLRSQLWQAVKSKIKWVLLVSGSAVAGLFFADRGVEWMRWMAGAGDSVLLVFFTAVLILAISKDGFGKFVAPKWTKALGKYSYAMYLFQEPIALAIAPRILASTTRFQFWIKLTFIPAAIGLTFLLALASWKYFERRFLALKDRWAPRDMVDRLPGI